LFGAAGQGRRPRDGRALVAALLGGGPEPLVERNPGNLRRVDGRLEGPPRRHAHAARRRGLGGPAKPRASRSPPGKRTLFLFRDLSTNDSSPRRRRTTAFPGNPSFRPQADPGNNVPPKGPVSPKPSFGRRTGTKVPAPQALRVRASPSSSRSSSSRRVLRVRHRAALQSSATPRAAESPSWGPIPTPAPSAFRERVVGGGLACEFLRRRRAEFRLRRTSWGRTVGQGELEDPARPCRAGTAAREGARRPELDAPQAD